MAKRVYDGATFEWVTPEEKARRTAEREELAFRRRLRQGQLACPSVISDCQGGVRGIQSMVDGQYYDSKSAMRKHYRREGVVEVGNDIETERHKQPPSYMEREARRRQIHDACERAAAWVNTTTPGAWDA